MLDFSTFLVYELCLKLKNFNCKKLAINLEKKSEDYGVVINKRSLKIDKNKTKKLRSKKNIH